MKYASLFSNIFITHEYLFKSLFSSFQFSLKNIEVRKIPCINQSEKSINRAKYKLNFFLCFSNNLKFSIYF